MSAATQPDNWTLLTDAAHRVGVSIARQVAMMKTSHGTRREIMDLAVDAMVSEIEDCFGDLGLPDGAISVLQSLAIEASEAEFIRLAHSGAATWGRA